jgi:hypothetical protein
MFCGLQDKYEFLSDVFDEDTGAVKDKYILYLLQKHYAIVGPGIVYTPATPVPDAKDVKADVKSDVKAEEPVKPPELKRQGSAHEDPRMPPVINARFFLFWHQPLIIFSLFNPFGFVLQMIRRVSLEEEKLALAQEQSLHAKPIVAQLAAAHILADHIVRGLERTANAADPTAKK